MEEELWRRLPEFPDYGVSNFGRIWNFRHDHEMRVSVNNFGHVKISLLDSETGERFTRSVAQLVGEAFIVPPNDMCDQIVPLDGDHTNLNWQNLVWRPSSFAWRYIRQIRSGQPKFYRNLPVEDVAPGHGQIEYASIVAAGMTQGLLFDDVWRSTYEWTEVFPTGAIFQVIKDARLRLPG